MHCNKTLDGNAQARHLRASLVPKCLAVSLPKKPCLFLVNCAANAQAADPLEPLVKQYDEATTELAKRRKAGLKTAGDRYLEALEETMKLALKGGSTLVIRAIEEEMSLVKAGGALPRKAAADIPRQVHTERRKYVSSES